jgi:hypothetical protein
MRRPVRGGFRYPMPAKKAFVFRLFLTSAVCQLASICVNINRTCLNVGTELTQPCSAPVLPACSQVRA